MTPDLTGFEASAAADIVRQVAERLAGWDLYNPGPGLWSWRLELAAGHVMVVAVNALEDRVLVPVEGWPAKVGPTVLAGEHGRMFASVTLPHVSDRHQQGDALALLARFVPELDPEGTPDVDR